MLRRDCLTSAAASAVALGMMAGCALSSSSQAQERTGSQYPTEAEITFQWNYSCPAKTICSFSCPPRGGANNVKTLTVYFAKVHSTADRDTFALFYEFTSVAIPRGNGFSIVAGLSRMSCQVNGMALDYSGPRRTTSLQN
jgi:hypothetical protein